MQERKRAEALARQDRSTTTAGVLSHSSVDLSTNAANGSSSPLCSNRESDFSATSRDLYLARKKSIVDGLTAHELLLQHRRSLLGLPVDVEEEMRPAIADLEGITLSKRHTFSKSEYEAGHNSATFAQLQSFKVPFGDDSAEGGNGNTDH